MKKLYIYPVRGIAGIEVDKLELIPEGGGVKYDRVFVILQKGKKDPVTVAKVQFGKLSELKQEFVDGYKKLRITHGESLIDLDMESPLEEVYEDTFTKYKLKGFMMPEDVNKWFQEFLGLDDIFVIRSMPAYSRPMAYSEKIIEMIDGDITSNFIKDSPFHIINQGSVDDLKEKSGVNFFEGAVFRPNIVLNHPVPFDEDNFYQMRVGNVMIRQTGPCKRCKVVTVDFEQKGHNEDGEPLTTLSKYRNCKGIGALFGIYAAFDILPENHESQFTGDGTIKLDDTLYVRTRKQMYKIDD